jgi:hypothetical protein
MLDDCCVTMVCRVAGRALALRASGQHMVSAVGFAEIHHILVALSPKWASIGCSTRIAMPIAGRASSLGVCC